MSAATKKKERSRRPSTWLYSTTWIASISSWTSSTGYRDSAAMPPSSVSTWAMHAPAMSNTPISTAKTCPRCAIGSGLADGGEDLMLVLVVNAGSSSLKLRVLRDDDEVEAEHDIERWDVEDEATELAGLLAGLPPFDAVG